MVATANNWRTFNIMYLHYLQNNIRKIKHAETSGLITCLLNRAKTICSTESLFRSEVTMLKEMFFKNGYPAWFFNKTLDSFCNSSQQENDQTSEDENGNQKLYL